jgi:hypothetical protein
MDDTITRRQLLEQRIQQTQELLAKNEQKRKLAAERDTELRAKLALYQRDLNAL